MKNNNIIIILLILTVFSVDIYAQEKAESAIAEQPAIVEQKEEELSSAQVAMLMEQINENMNILNVELDLTRQAHDYLLKEYDELKRKQEKSAMLSA